MNSINQIPPLELLDLYLTDGKSTGPRESKLFQKFNSELTWDALLNEGYQEDLAPMLYYIITKWLPTLRYKGLAVSNPINSIDSMNPINSINSINSLSPEIKDKLKSLYNQYLVQNMIQFKELDTILNAFEKEGIDVIQLKGAWIAKNYYPDPALRPMGDLDLLVRKEDMKRAKECLINLGYALAEGPDEETYEKRHFHFPCIKHNTIFSTVVELHHNFSRVKYDFIDYDIGEFWENASRVSDSCKYILTIPKEYLLLHLFWHTYLNLSNTLYIRIMWLIDIAYIIQKNSNNINWLFIEKKAKEWGIQKQVYFCLYLINQFFGTIIDEKIASAIMPPIYSIKLFNFIILKNENDVQTFRDPNRIFIKLLNLISLNTINDKIRYLFRPNPKDLLNKAERIRRKYRLSSKNAVYLFYVIHPIILTMRGLKWIYKIIAGGSNTQKSFFR